MFRAAPRSPEITPIEQKVVDRFERKTRPRRQLAKLGLALAGTSLIHGYAYDVTVQKDIKDNAAISINSITETPLEAVHDNRAIVAIDGFGSYDSNWLATHLGTEVQQLYDGHVWSVSYGNAPLNEATIAQRIIEKAEAENVDTIALLGDSAGGVVSTEVIPHILNKSDITVELSINASTPSGDEGLRPNKQQEVATAKVLRTIIPGIEYSTYARNIVELGFWQQHIKDWDSFWQIQDGIQAQLNNKYLPKTWLLFDQALAVSNADFPAQYQKISDMTPEEQAPVIVNLISSDYDPIVNDRYSSEKICEAATNAHLDCTTYVVDGAVHARPDLSIESYREVLSSIEPTVTATISYNRTVQRLSQLALEADQLTAALQK